MEPIMTTIGPLGRAAILAAFALALAWGQAVSTSQIRGVVQDATGLAVPGAASQFSVSNTNNRGVYPGIANFSVAGGLSQGNSYTLDGAFHNDVYASSALPLPFPDAVQEFKVETSSLGAQYGYHSGGAINA